MGHTRFPIVEVGTYPHSPSFTFTDVFPFPDCLLLQIHGVDASTPTSDLDPAQLSAPQDEEQEEDRGGERSEDQPAGSPARHGGNL